GTLFYWRARARVFIARDIKTVEDYTKALEYGYEDRYGVYILRGKANDALGRRREALRDLTAAVNIEPEQTRAYGERGALLYVLKRYVPAERDLSRALELDPSESGALVYLGLIDLVMGRYDRAEERFGKAMSSERDRVIAHHNLAAVYLLTRRPGKANDLLREVWRDFDTQTNNYVYAAVLRYFCLLNQEKEGAGRAFLEEVYDSAAPNIRAYPLLRYLNGDWSADELIGSFGDDRQGQTMAHAVIGLENLYAGRKSEAVEHLRRSVHEGAAAPFSTQALLEYRNLAAEDPGLKDVVPASVYFEPDPVRQGHWGRLVAEYIPFPGEVTVKETWTIHSPGLTSPPLDKAYTITHEDHRHVSDFRIPEKIEPGLYELRMKVTFDGEERKIAGEFKIR
ncbi:MAG: tetratricopeptide repeat protein, partial [Spirochaetota bacterium]